MPNGMMSKSLSDTSTPSFPKVDDLAFGPDPDYAFADSTDVIDPALHGLFTQDKQHPVPSIESKEFVTPVPFSSQSFCLPSPRYNQSQEGGHTSATRPSKVKKHPVYPAGSLSTNLTNMDWRQTLPSPVPAQEQIKLSHHQSVASKSTPISSSVAQQFGQITPPEDRPLSVETQVEQQPSSGEMSPKLDKSERARNAANHRHSKMKRSISAVDKPQLEPGAGRNAVDAKKEKYREKNRAAAAKCRAKKKESTDLLEDVHRDCSARSKMLRREEQELREELLQLKSIALQHTNCNCGQIHQYNSRQAQLYAEGGGLIQRRSGSIPGPDSRAWQDTLPSPSFLDVGESPGSSSSFDFASMPNFSDLQTFGDPVMADFMTSGSPSM